ncbi:imidazolonepropionase [Endozoicomonas sp. SM1973]|uniref:Imidazolonepropionase n=1 Tax=Spartinivicinus marinus TaxID=2994442 RepID=A0A853I4M4_9GAMM|nr:imidazolonepropionase [Spartinivicinus marinus]MCX4025664.1 imidazolonepropionase [Spartinivicinus marinus]NYZ68313.1 imidazolonepropionase [Spartinivicinus marinus]
MEQTHSTAIADTVWTNVNLITGELADQGLVTAKNQSVVVKDGRIMAIFDQSSGAALPQAERIIDGEGGWLSPGLIDCHTHLVFAGNRADEFEQRLEGVPYETIAKQGGGILSTVIATRSASEEALLKLALPRLDALIAEGVTTVEIKSGYGLTLNDELKILRVAKQLANHRPINISTTLLAAHAVPPEFKGKADQYIDLVCNEIIPQAAEQQLADAVDVFCEGIGFSPAQSEKVMQAAKACGLGVKAHVEQLSNLSGAALTAKYQGWSADHLEYLDEAGVKALAESNTAAVLLPGAFYFLREQQLPPIDLLRKYQVPMALATDFNPGTSPLASIRLMMNMGCTLFRMTPSEVIAAVTANGAKALKMEESRGIIKEGMAADMVLWDIQHLAELAYQFGPQVIKQRMVNGQITGSGAHV